MSAKLDELKIETQKEECRLAMLKALTKNRFFLEKRERDPCPVSVVSSVTRYIHLGGCAEKPYLDILTDFMTDGKVLTFQSGAPYRVEGGTYLAFCKLRCSFVSCWDLELYITPEANPDEVAKILGTHKFFAHRGAC